LVPLLFISTTLALAAAMLVAYYRGSLTDRGIMIACTVGQSVSILVYILLLQYWLAYQLGWFPVQGWGSTLGENLLGYAALPILVGVVVSLAPDIRLYRSFFLEEVNQDYVRTARAKGMSEGRVMWVHVLRNAAIPIVTITALQFGTLLGGAVVTETVFAWPGIGRLAIQSIYNRDYPVVQCVVFLSALLFIVINLTVELIYGVLDPRIRPR